MIAFKNAIGIADMIELDVCFSRDRQIVVIHDSTLDRTTNGSGDVAKNVFSYMQKLDAGSWFSPEFNAARIPLLQEVLAIIKDEKILLNIEIKTEAYEDGVNRQLGSYELIEKQVVRMVEESGLVHRTIISSFNHKMLERVRNFSSEIKIAVLIDKIDQESIDLARKINAYSINPPLTIVTKEFVERIHSLPMKLLVWTVNDLPAMKKMLAFGVDGMFTNYPNILYSLIKIEIS